MLLLYDLKTMTSFIVYTVIDRAEGCRCTDDWRGETCEIEVDPNCQGVDCLYGLCTVSEPGELEYTWDSVDCIALFTA